MKNSGEVIFLTNIRCENCKQTIEKAFEGQNLYENWEVDLANPDRPARFRLKEGVKPEQVQKIIREAGYKAEIADKYEFMTGPDSDNS